MYPMEIINGVKLVTQTCLEVRKGLKAIIVAYGDEDVRLASLLAAEMQEQGAEVGIVIVPPPKAVEPPAFLAEAMKKVDVLISMGEVDYGHTLARKEAPSLIYGYMPAVMRTMMGEVTYSPEDLLEIQERTETLAEAVSAAKEAHITSFSGTDLVLNIEGRKAIPIHPILRKPGSLAIIPYYSEVACPPLERKGHGTYVVNGSVWGHRSMECIVSEPLTWRVEEGKVVAMEGGPEARMILDALAGFDENAWYIGELGIGTNHRLPNRLTGTKVDDSILGHVHLALGRNVALGGNQWSQIHVDFLSMDVRISLDGKVVLENGKILL
jgi:leucyl aminopeptidase (aminopeptidase T)